MGRAANTRRGGRGIDRGALLREAEEHRKAGRLQAAAARYEQVLRQRPTDAAALAGLGRVTGEAGDAERGIDLLRRAIASYGRRADDHVQLAALLGQVGRVEEALASARRAVALEPRNVQGHTLLALSYGRMNRTREGIAAARKCMAIADSADTRIVLANLLRRAGDLDEARSIVEPVVATEQRSNRLAGAYHELGFILDGLGEYDAAFEAFTRAGVEDGRQPGADRIDGAGLLDRIRRYRHDFTADLLRRDAGAPAGPAPVFLVGFPRSGTTMTEQVLASHPRVVTSGEQPHLGAVLNELRATEGGDADLAGVLERLEPDRIAGLRERYWAAVRPTLDEALDGRVYVDKLPLNLVELGVINMVFPDTRVIVALRDPRDVCLSCFMQRFQLNPAMIHFLSLEGAATLYAEAMGLWLELRERLTVPWIEVRYEDTVRDLEAQARRILDLVGVDWDPCVLAFHERARNHFPNTPSYAAVSEPVHTRAVARWRPYAAHFQAVTPMLAPFLEAFGYEAAS